MEFDFDTARDIIGNKDHPLYVKYHNFDQDVHGAVTRAYVKKYPGDYDPNNTTPAALPNPPLAKAGDPQPGSDQADAGEDPERAAAEKSLIEHWGAEAQAKVQVVSEWARSSIGEDGLETLHQKYPGLLNDVGIIKALHAALSR